VWHQVKGRFPRQFLFRVERARLFPGGTVGSNPSFRRRVNIGKGGNFAAAYGSEATGSFTEFAKRAELRRLDSRECFNGRLRDELLNETLFGSLAHARVALAEWRLDYNRASEHPSVYVIEEKRLC
jgi:transposase InsO family protein